MAILYDAKQRAIVEHAKRIKRKATKEAQKNRPKLDKGPERNPDYKAWLRAGGMCLACQIEGPVRHPTLRNVIEAAHIWLAEGAMKGVRNSDWTCTPLCTWHHQHAPDACDKAQRRFFDRLGLDPIDVVEAFNAAFVAGREAFWVVQEIVAKRLDGTVVRRSGT